MRKQTDVSEIIGVYYFKGDFASCIIGEVLIKIRSYNTNIDFAA